VGGTSEISWEENFKFEISDFRERVPPASLRAPPFCRRIFIKPPRGENAGKMLALRLHFSWRPFCLS
jgi:hypothetical protein